MSDAGESKLLSVVIPTRDRPERLRENLLALAQQEAGDAFEVIVVDDGSAAKLTAITANLPSLPYNLRLERQPPQGPAAARNLGIRLARGQRILLLGDDTRPAPGCLQQHLSAGASEKAVQGYIDWDPEQEITPLMHFLAPAGPQFYFKGLKDGAPISFRAVLGANFSAPRPSFLAEPSDEAFREAAAEDTELAWRWQQRGFPMVFCREAICWHHHLYRELAPFLDRQQRAGRAARLAVARHRQLRWPLYWEPLLYGLWVRLRGLGGRARPTDGWDLACREAYRQGYRQGSTLITADRGNAAAPGEPG